MIRGGRFPTQFQPVGGVFKVAATGRGKLVELGAADDLIPLDTASADDLRIRLEGCRLVSFLKWFESGQGRETSPWREFQEELVASGLVPAHLFPNIFHEKLWDVRKFRWSEPNPGV